MITAVTLALALVGGLASSPASAAACGPILSKLSSGAYDLCSLSVRYQRAYETLQSKHGLSDPDRMADILAPRFINISHWEAAKVNKTFIKHDVAFNPWVTYCPAPQTWGAWEAGNAIVSSEARKDFANGRLSPISEQWIRDLWGAAVPAEQQDAGYRDTADEKSDTDQDSDSPLTVKQADYIAGLDSSRPFPFRKYWESPVGGSAMVLEKRKNCGKFDDGSPKVCTVIRYVNGLEVPYQMRALSAEFNAWASKGAAGFSTTDFLTAVAKLQLWIPAIHPFFNGNGRTSRLLMDRILLSVGLPAPMLRNQDIDYFFTPAEWSREIHEGIQWVVQRFEQCAQAAPGALPAGCREISLSPPALNEKAWKEINKKCNEE